MSGDSPPAVAAPPAKSKAPKAAARPIPVKLPEADTRIPEPEPTKLYELRTLDGCPRQNLTCAGIATFARYRGVPQMSVEGEIVGHVDYGNRQRLTDAQVKKVLESIRKRVVVLRPNGGGLYCVGDPALAGLRRDDVLPLGKFLSMTEIPEDLQEAEKEQPVSMAG